MAKVRVYELARNLGINSKKLITVLRELNVDVKNHMSTMEEDVAKRVMDMLTKGEKKPIDAQAEAGDNVKRHLRLLPKTAPQKQVNKKVVKEGRKPGNGKLIRKTAGDGAETLLLEGRVTVGELAGRINVPVSDILQNYWNWG